MGLKRCNHQTRGCAAYKSRMHMVVLWHIKDIKRGCFLGPLRRRDTCRRLVRLCRSSQRDVPARRVCRAVIMVGGHAIALIF